MKLTNPFAKKSGDAEKATSPQHQQQQGDQQQQISLLARLTGSIFMLLTQGLAVFGWSLTFIGLCGIAFDIEARGMSMGWAVQLLSPILIASVSKLSYDLNLHPGPYQHMLAILLAMVTVLGATFLEKVTAALSVVKFWGILYLLGAIVQLSVQTAWVMYLASPADSQVVALVESFDSVTMARDRDHRRRTVMSMGMAPQLPFVAPGSPMNLPAQTAPHLYAPPMPSQLQQQVQVQHQAQVPYPPQQLQQQSLSVAADDAQSAVSTGSQPPQYTYRAKALYAYTADAADPQEVSFAAEEVLEVANPHGNRWWQVRKANGTAGIAPSNYLQLLN
ncbi:hypothetical protein BC828DRAFT_438805 [Blastocladiella britannica]|nr:hypothetical protein BC828DRAFT_438805 [Blastocladiella britannica]